MVKVQINDVCRGTCKPDVEMARIDHVNDINIRISGTGVRWPITARSSKSTIAFACRRSFRFGIRRHAVTMVAASFVSRNARKWILRALMIAPWLREAAASGMTLGDGYPRKSALYSRGVGKGTNICQRCTERHHHAKHNQRHQSRHPNCLLRVTCS